MSILDLSRNSDNICDLHPLWRENVNLDVTFNEATQMIITVVIYRATSRGITDGKNFDAQILSSDY